MSMKTKLVWGVAIVAVAMLLPARARAQSCNTTYSVVPDGRLLPFTVAPNGDVGFMFSGTQGHSYSVEVENPNRSGVYSVTLGDANVACPGVGTSVGGFAGTPGVNPIMQVGFRGSFTATVSGSPSYTIRFVEAGGSTQNIYLSVSDTTLYSPAWSTNGTYDTFYSLLNTTNAACTGTLTLFSTTGTALTTAPLTIPSGATASTNTQALSVVRNTTGTAKFTHNCPPGAFIAEAAVANFSFSPTPYVQFVHFQPTRESAH
jgi:hypothetical protein